MPKPENPLPNTEPRPDKGKPGKLEKGSKPTEPKESTPKESKPGPSEPKRGAEGTSAKTKPSKKRRKGSGKNILAEEHEDEDVSDWALSDSPEE